MPKVFGLILLVSVASGARASAQTSLASAAAQQNSALQSGAMMNMMMGGMLMTSCMSAQKPDMMICLLGGMALMQGMQQNQAAQAANQAIAASAAQPTAYTVLSPTTPLPATYQAPATVSSGLAALSTAGYKIASTGITLPGGKFVPSSALESPDPLKHLGFSDTEIAHATAVTAALAKQITK